MTTLRLRRFAGFTPHNAADRTMDWRENRPTGAQRWCILRYTARYAYWGPLRDADIYRALATMLGSAYRAGDAGRRRRL